MRSIIIVLLFYKTVLVLIVESQKCFYLHTNPPIAFFGNDWSNYDKAWCLHSKWLYLNVIAYPL